MMIMAIKKKQVAVIGLGGIGGTVAGFLARAGEKVTVVDNSRVHIEAIRSNGLLVDGILGEQRVNFDNVLLPEEIKGPLDLVFLAVKSHHTEQALTPVIPFISKKGVIVSLQNGLNERKIAELAGPSRALGAMVHMVGAYIEPGHVTRFKKGEFYLGELDGKNTDRIQQIAAILSQIVPTYTTDNIWGYLWSKLIATSFRVATGLVDAPSKDILKPEWARRIFVAIMGEATEAALAEGVQLEEYDGFNPVVTLARNKAELSQALKMLPTGSAKGNSGSWRDIKIFRQKTECEFTTGEIVRAGQKNGLPMTLNTRVARMIKEEEEGLRNMSWDNLRKLEKTANERLPS